jgi:hypothetical protein
VLQLTSICEFANVDQIHSSYQPALTCRYIICTSNVGKKMENVSTKTFFNGQRLIIESEFEQVNQTVKSLKQDSKQ